VIVKAMGEKAPIAENEFADGRDNPTGRAKNRRVMFKLFSDDNKFEIMYDNAGPATDE
jgi:outer membrane protein OmpA-like peptidoglycan-associated protein